MVLLKKRSLLRIIEFRFQHENLEQSEARSKSADWIPESGCVFHIRALKKFTLVSISSQDDPPRSQRNTILVAHPVLPLNRFLVIDWQIKTEKTQDTAYTPDETRKTERM